MTSKTQQLQIRVTPAEKAALKRKAAAAGMGMSSYVLSRVLTDEETRFHAIVRSLAEAEKPSYPLAELSDLLADLAPDELATLQRPGLEELTPLLQNYVAAMVERAAWLKDVAPPAWTVAVAPLDEPYFATPLPGLRLHLLKSSPVPFKQRNLFVDSSVGDRV